MPGPTSTCDNVTSPPASQASGRRRYDEALEGSSYIQAPARPVSWALGVWRGQRPRGPAQGGAPALREGDNGQAVGASPAARIKPSSGMGENARVHFPSVISLDSEPNLHTQFSGKERNSPPGAKEDNALGRPGRVRASEWALSPRTAAADARPGPFPGTSWRGPGGSSLSPGTNFSPHGADAVQAETQNAAPRSLCTINTDRIDAPREPAPLRECKSHPRAELDFRCPRCHHRASRGTLVPSSQAHSTFLPGWWMFQAQRGAGDSQGVADQPRAECPLGPTTPTHGGRG